jgi:hypothetical protein
VPLLEREPALALLRRYAHEADAAAGRLVLVSGEAGAGKTALVEGFAREMPGTRWWWAACEGSFVPRPLGPLLDLADRLGGELADLCRGEAPREQLFPALLRRLDRPGGLDVVVVEDVHWADEATLDLLRYLGRRIRSSRILLLVTYREDERASSYPLRVTLGDLVAQPGTRRIGVGPLSVEAVGRLAAGSPFDAAELHRTTGATPSTSPRCCAPAWTGCRSRRAMPCWPASSACPRTAGRPSTSRRSSAPPWNPACSSG